MFQDQRWRRLLPRLAGFLALQFGLLFVIGQALFESTGIALMVAGVLATMTGVGGVLAAETVWSDRPAGQRRWFLVYLWAATFGLAAGLVLYFWLPVSWPTAAMVGVAAAVGAAVVHGRRSRGEINARQMSLAIVRVADPQEAEVVIRDCTHALADPRLTADRRTVTELNRARAQVMLALRRNHGHHLQEALATLRRILQDPAIDPLFALLAASDLVDAMNLAAEQTRDPQGYEEAQRLLDHCMSRVPEEIRSSTRLAAHRASFALFLARDGDPDHYPRAVAQLEAAIASSRSPSAPDLANLGLMLSLSASITGVDRSKDAIAFCHQAVRLSQDDETLFPVAQCLASVATTHDAASGERLSEARAILRRLARRKGPLSLRAKQMLADLDRAA